MSKFKLMGRFSALESDVPESTVSAAEDIPQDVLETAVDTEVDGTDTVEGHAVDAEEAEADVVEADAAAEDLQETSEALESYLEIVQDARMSRRGLTKGEAHILYVGINNAVKKVGLDVGDVAGNVSVESFDGGRDSLGRCASLENAIVDAIKKFWEAIKNQISKMVKYVRDWWLKHLDGAARMKKKAEKLKEKAGGTNGTAKEKKVNLSVHRLLSENKKVSKASFILSGLGTITTAITEMGNSKTAASFETNLTTVEEVVDSIYDQETGTADMQEINKVSRNNLGAPHLSILNTKNDPWNSILGTDGITKNAGVSDDLPGHKAIVCVGITAANHTKPEELANEIKLAADNSQVTVRYTTAKVPEIDSSAEYAVLSTSECVDLCDGVIKMCDATMAYKQNFDKYEKATKKFLSKMDTVYKKTVKSDSPEARANAQIGKTLGGAAATFIRKRNSSITAVISYGMGLGRGTLVYVQASLSQYKD